MSEKRRGEVRKKIWKNTEETGFRFSPDGILHCEEPAVSFFEENPKNLLAALKIAAKSGAVLREDVERAVFQCFRNIVRLSGKDVLDELVAADLRSLCGFHFGPLQGCFRLCYTGAGADV